MTDDRVNRLVGERVPGWIPLTMAIIGLVASIATAQLAVDAAESPAAEEPPSTLQSSNTDEESTAPTTSSSTTSAPPSSPETSAARELDEQSDEEGDDKADGKANLDCPPLFTTTFPSGGAEPLSEPGREVEILASWMSAHLEAQLLIEGHADAEGSEQANLKLSFRRAEAVTSILIDAGVPSDRLQPRGYGEYQPIAGVAPDSQQNRRVTMQAPGFDTCPIADTDTDTDTTE